MYAKAILIKQKQKKEKRQEPSTQEPIKMDVNGE